MCLCTILYEARAKYISRSPALLFDVMPRKTMYNRKLGTHRYTPIRLWLHSFESYRHGFCTCSLIIDRHRCRRRRRRRRHQRLRSYLFAYIPPLEPAEKNLFNNNNPNGPYGSHDMYRYIYLVYIFIYIYIFVLPTI